MLNDAVTEIHSLDPDQTIPDHLSMQWQHLLGCGAQAKALVGPACYWNSAFRK